MEGGKEGVCVGVGGRRGREWEWEEREDQTQVKVKVHLTYLGFIPVLWPVLVSDFSWWDPLLGRVMHTILVLQLIVLPCWRAGVLLREQCSAFTDRGLRSLKHISIR